MIKWKKKLQMPKKYLSMLGMARRAGRLAMGHDMALGAVCDKKATLIIFASDISERLIEEFKLARDKRYPELEMMRISESIDELHRALGYKAGVIAVNDSNFSVRLIELIKQEEDEYGNKD